MLSNELMDDLIKDGAKSVKISVKAAPQESFPKNVVGVIRGKQGVKSALVLTAHFDHVGRQGDFFFNGMLDNASGTAVMMSAADKLKKTVKENTLDYDIIIAAVNSEETRGKDEVMQGSASLAAILSKNYKQISNINIDCLGLKKETKFDMGSPDAKSQDLTDLIKAEMDNANLEYEKSVYLISDHVSFQKYNYPAITVGSAFNQRAENTIVFHSNQYTKEDFDFDIMEKTADAIAKASANAGKAFVTEEEIAEMDENIEKIAKDVVLEQLKGKKLAFNQGIFVMVNGQVMNCGQSEYVFHSTEEMKNITAN